MRQKTFMAESPEALDEQVNGFFSRATVRYSYRRGAGAFACAHLMFFWVMFDIEEETE